jgi:hypothetical protein
MSMLDIMIDNARYFYAQALDAEAALAQLQTDVVKDIEPEEQYRRMLAEVKHAAGLAREGTKKMSGDFAPEMLEKVGLRRSRSFLLRGTGTPASIAFYHRWRQELKEAPSPDSHPGA